MAKKNNRFWFDVQNYIDMVHDEFLMTDDFQTRESLWAAFWDGVQGHKPYHGEGSVVCDKVYKKGKRMEGAEIGPFTQDLSTAWGRWSKQLAAVVHGRGVQLHFQDGSMQSAHYALVESQAVSPSHIPFAHYQENDGYPCMLNSGETMATKDYSAMSDKQKMCGLMARDYDERAIVDCPIVSFEGIVLRGNLRAMASLLAARWNTDGRYTDYLWDHCVQYGFSQDDLRQFLHPRLVIVASRQRGHQYSANDFVRYAECNIEKKP